MQLNRCRTHASTTITTSESSSSGGSREGRGWNIEERDRESESERERGGGDALSAAETLHHRLPRWEGGRVGGRVDGGREVLLPPALFLSLCLKSKYNIYDAATV